MTHHRSAALTPGFASLIATTVLGMAQPALAQSSADESDFVYMGRSASVAVMVSGLPPTPASGQHTIWVWHLGGADHPRSNDAGPFTRAVRMTVDCSDRTTINRAAEHFNGTTFVDRMSLTDVANWSRHAPGSLGLLPVTALCDAPPPATRPRFTDFGAARAYATLRLKPSPS